MRLSHRRAVVARPLFGQIHGVATETRGFRRPFDIAWSVADVLYEGN